MHDGVWLQRCLPSLSEGEERGRGKGVREVNAEELMMMMTGGGGGEEGGKPLQLPDNLASYETLSYVK